MTTYGKRRGWNRSFHQRLFHEEYLKSCTRVFFKRDGPGCFERSVFAVVSLVGRLKAVQGA